MVNPPPQIITIQARRGNFYFSSFICFKGQALLYKQPLHLRCSVFHNFVAACATAQPIL